MTPLDLLSRYAATETSLWVADRRSKNRWGERRGFPLLAAAIEAIGKLPAGKVVVDIVVHEPGYDRTVTAGEIEDLFGAVGKKARR